MNERGGPAGRPATAQLNASLDEDSGSWIVEGLIPAGTIVAVADLGDPEPDELIAAGFDVVLRLHCVDDCTDGPVRLTTHWRPGLVPGRTPPEPIWIERREAGFELVEAAA